MIGPPVEKKGTEKVVVGVKATDGQKKEKKKEYKTRVQLNDKIARRLLSCGST